MTATAERITVRLDEAPALRGVSRDTGERHVRPHVREITIGRVVLFAIDDVRAWAKAASRAPRVKP